MSKRIFAAFAVIALVLALSAGTASPSVDALAPLGIGFGIGLAVSAVVSTPADGHRMRSPYGAVALFATNMSTAFAAVITLLAGALSRVRSAPEVIAGLPRRGKQVTFQRGPLALGINTS